MTRASSQLGSRGANRRVRATSFDDAPERHAALTVTLRLNSRLTPRATRAIAIVFVVLVTGSTLWQRFAPQGATESSVVVAERSRAKDISVDASGVVTRLLADDNEGSRHQRFIIQVTTDLTVLIVHNIDLAPRVPLQVGDSVAVRGDYVWNEQGGLIHWTHHDPDGRHVPGWIEIRGRRYQ